MIRNGMVVSLLAGLVLLTFPMSAQLNAQSGNTQEEKALVPAGPVPDATLLVLGNIQGKIEPCA